MGPQVIRYWGRKAGNLARDYILRFSNENDVILDPFGGSGSIIYTALALKRRGIYNDLNPFAHFIASVIFEGVPAHDFTYAYKDILSRKRVYFFKDGKKHWLTLSKFYDAPYYVQEELHDNNSIEPIYPYPKAPLYYKNGKPFYKRRQVNRIDELFTKRNLVLLSTLLHDIKNVKGKRVRNGLLLAFASILFRSSKMNREHAGSWGVPCYWIPKVHTEKNPYLLFERTVKRVEKLKGFRVGSVEDVLNNAAEVSLLQSDAKKLPIPDESVDLIVTDPPFTDEIQYFELSYLASSWLGFEMPFEDEIIVNPNQGKDFKKYLDDLSLSFKEMYRVLKKGRPIIIMFHEEDENVIAKIIDNLPFDIQEIKDEIMKQRNIGDRESERGKKLKVIVAKKFK